MGFIVLHDSSEGLGWHMFVAVSLASAHSDVSLLACELSHLLRYQLVL